MLFAQFKMEIALRDFLHRIFMTFLFFLSAFRFLTLRFGAPCFAYFVVPMAECEWFSPKQSRKLLEMLGIGSSMLLSECIAREKNETWSKMFQCNPIHSRHEMRKWSSMCGRWKKSERNNTYWLKWNWKTHQPLPIKSCEEDGDVLLFHVQNVIRSKNWHNWIRDGGCASVYVSPVFTINTQFD